MTRKYRDTRKSADDTATPGDAGDTPRKRRASDTSDGDRSREEKDRRSQSSETDSVIVRPPGTTY